MHDLTSFEQRLAERLGAEYQAIVPAFEPDRIARAAMVPRSRWDRVRNPVAVRYAASAGSRRLALVVVVALLALVVVALAVGLQGPSGSRLVLIDTSGGVLVGPADASDLSRIFDVENPVLFTKVAWAPDGRHLALVDEQLRLTILDDEGIVRGTRDLANGLGMLAWSPDGQRIAYSESDHVEGDPAGYVRPRLDILRLDGSVDWTAPLPEGFRRFIGTDEVAWSPDGRSIVVTGTTYRGARDGPSTPSTLWLLDVQERSVRSLMQEDSRDRDYYPTWLPDGRILFAQVDTGVWVMDPASGQQAQLVDFDDYPCDSPCPNRIASTLVPSPDGARLAFVAPRLGLRIMDLSAGTMTEPLVLPEGSGADVPIRWTADGTALVVRVGPVTDEPFFADQVGRLDLATGELTILATNVVRFDLWSR